MEHLITVAKETDIELLLELMQEFYIIEHLNYDENVIRKGLLEIFENKNYGYALLIKTENKPAGYFIVTFGFSLEFHGRDALLDEFYIRKEFRSKGIGTMCLDYLESLCSKEGIHAVHLEVDRTNLRAKELYHRSGYEDHNRHLLTKWLVR
jgi:ribosomal protein S18 acetylase RimI-like enzyme